MVRKSILEKTFQEREKVLLEAFENLKSIQDNILDFVKAGE